MRDRPLFISIPIIVLVSAVIAYGIVFLIPSYTGYNVYDYIDTSTPKRGYSYDYSYDFAPDITDLTKLQPQEFQEVVQRLFDDLIKLTEAQLYMLNSVDDVCRTTLIECQGIPSKTVKPFVEKALAHKQARETVAIASGSLDIARFSLAVAFAAFLVSVIGLFVKRTARSPS